MNDKEPASYFHQRFEKMFEIPYRCIYSKNIDNLMFAGRNVSVTHIALSATRLIAICGLVGQAAGTAAAMCMEYKTSPRGVYKKHIPELQERLYAMTAIFRTVRQTTGLTWHARRRLRLRLPHQVMWLC